MTENTDKPRLVMKVDKTKEEYNKQNIILFSKDVTKIHILQTS